MADQSAEMVSGGNTGVPEVLDGALINDLRELILAARNRVARAVNSEIVLLYWQVGTRIREDVLHHSRAEYGKQVVESLADNLTQDYGRGFSAKNLFRMMQLAEKIPDHTIVSTLSRQLSWSHFLELLPIKDDLERDFYTEMCRIERWSVRTLRSKIDGMLYQRTALSRKPDELIRQELDILRGEEKLTPDLVFRDLISSISSAFSRPILSAISNLRSYGNWSSSSSNSAQGSHSSIHCLRKMVQDIPQADSIFGCVCKVGGW